MTNHIQFASASAAPPPTTIKLRKKFKPWKGKGMKSPANYVPCPQHEWKKIMEKSIEAKNPSVSINRIQSNLSERQRDAIFIVLCSLEAQKDQMVKLLKFPPKNQKSCQVIRDQVWCQAIGL
ncbi:hypothetical protein niasHT_020325 [Heterodera trifolii]|uniref:Uncharacterized protein n=1 Tax=Heterodera trifolii TaxID=157864 RepID=A0ABD2K448_9BILA